jgi:hypothetical protein
MKKKYFLFAFLLTSLVGFAQNVTITKIIETDCSSPFVKTVELYVDGTVNFSTDVVVNYMQNGAAWSENQIDVSALGTITDSFVYLVRDLDLMKAEFPSTTFDATNTVVVGSSTNGDDGYQVVLNGNIVSQFGRTETDADNDTVWEHDDSVVSRKSGIPDTGVWDETNWDYSGKNSLDGESKCSDPTGAGLEAFFDNLGGTYPLGSGSGWTPTADTCTTTLGDINTSCNTAVAGATDDTYTAFVDFAGGNIGKTFVITTTTGTIGGDNPTSTATGTIEITGIAEGTDITVTLKDTADGGVCDLSATIESPACIPLLINEVLFDPAGDDDQTTEVEGDANGDGTRDSAQDEFIEFYNNSNADLDISGYTISDGLQLRHTFPASTIIPANEFLVVFGGGTPTGTFGGAIVQTASEGANPELNLNNGGDVITIRNAADAIALVYDSGSTGVSHGDNQSVTRSPDVTGNFVLHTTANASLFFSPGLKVDGAVLSTEQNILRDVRFYPNPVNKNNGGFVTISSNSSEKITAKIYSVIGKMIKNISVNNNQIDITNLSTGLYLVKITQDNKSITKKLLIE